MSREEDLCVISDLCQQVRERDAKLERLREIDLILNSPDIHRESARDFLREKNAILHGTETPF